MGAALVARKIPGLLVLVLLTSSVAGCGDSERIGEWKKAKIREACFGEVAATNMWSPLGPTLPKSGHRISVQTAYRAAEMTSAMHCYVVTNKQSVCDKDNRAYIIDYIARYQAFINDMQRTAESYGESEKRNLAAFWNNARSRAIAAAIEDHIRNGRLNKGDFGWSRPDSLAELLEKHKGTPDSCAQEAAWKPPSEPYRMPTFGQALDSLERKR